MSSFDGYLSYFIAYYQDFIYNEQQFVEFIQ